jgi:anti-sigma B factor antagonist
MPVDEPAGQTDGPTSPGGASRAQLAVTVDPSGPAIAITVLGELDEGTAPGLVSQVGAAVEPGRDVVIDLGGLGFCGSAGLSALILVERQVAASGGALRLTGPGPFLVELLEMAGLDRLVTSAG